VAHADLSNFPKQHSFLIGQHLPATNKIIGKLAEIGVPYIQILNIVLYIYILYTYTLVVAGASKS
jgi:hypothetical protein